MKLTTAAAILALTGGSTTHSSLHAEASSLGAATKPLKSKSILDLVNPEFTKLSTRNHHRLQRRLKTRRARTTRNLKAHDDSSIVDVTTAQVLANLGPDLPECNPHDNSNADVGVLSCGSERECIATSSSSLGGRCVPLTSIRKKNRNLQAYVEREDPCAPDECDCSSFDAATQTGTVVCTYTGETEVVKIPGCFQEPFDYTSTATFENGRNTRTVYCYKASSDPDNEFCGFEDNTVAPGSTCAFSLNGETCASCTVVNYYYEIYDLDCSNVEGAPEFGVKSLYSLLKSALPAVESCSCTADLICEDGSPADSYENTVTTADGYTSSCAVVFDFFFYFGYTADEPLTCSVLPYLSPTQIFTFLGQDSSDFTQSCCPAVEVSTGPSSAPVDVEPVESEAPTSSPVEEATEAPTASPEEEVSAAPSASPVDEESAAPSASPVEEVTTASPVQDETASPTATPTASPTASPEEEATESPTAPPSDGVRVGTFSSALVGAFVSLWLGAMML